MNKILTTRELFIEIQEFLDTLGSGKPFSPTKAKELSEQISRLEEIKEKYA